MDGRFSDLIDSIAAATSRAALDQAFRQFAHSFDTDMFAFIVARTTSLDGVCNYPQPWRERYIAETFMRIDPVITTAKRIKGPFTWSAEGLHCSSPEEAMVLHEASEFGIRSGVSIPVELPYRTFTLLTLATGRSSISLDFKRHMGPCAVTACMADRVLNSTSRGREASRSADLTMRQLQCLVWASHGKRANETACILGISESAVSFHIKEARRRLNARSISEAIRVAHDLELLP
ncbi:autoinducer binding domain-containing protein [Agrobacterium tumefaciens]|uniref:autoinducer binding domain-containing protein n=1 Tax=Agrobacterium tumefaciens TaxID=358 RepID=UPI0022434D23|nr:autoinducer binding domain-containing protein [Agrobacterium tumefaciens]MCW8060199.1 LuxR family transcriptional regulator [Agrobacterium tumefaciens]